VIKPWGYALACGGGERAATTASTAVAASRLDAFGSRLDGLESRLGADER
jgi:hypothetical protein